MTNIKNIEAFILDVDGTLHEGGRPREGSIEFIGHLNENKIPYIILTNNTTKTVSAHVDQFSKMGFNIPSSSILTAANIVAQILLAEATQGKRCMVIGEKGLIDAIQQAGFEITQTDYHNVDYVVIGMDRQLTYDKLKVATLAIRSGAQFFSSNADTVFPDGFGVIPASGAIQAALEATTGKKARVTGKPHPSSFQIAMKMMGSKPSHTAMIGDQLEVDISGAKRVGMKAFLVLSSVTPRFIKANGSIVPDGVFENMMGFYRQWTAR